MGHSSALLHLKVSQIVAPIKAKTAEQISEAPPPSPAHPPCQTCYEAATLVLPPQNVRLDFLNMSRTTDADRRAYGHTIVKLLDLFEWEQGHGNWLAMTQLEFDIAWREIITPYNCREVLTIFLSVDECYRRAPDYTLFHRLIDKLWPEVMQEPINPRPRQSLRQRLKSVVRSLPRYWS